MKSGRINDRKLLRLVDNGYTQAEAARQFGVSRQAISQRMAELRGKSTRAVVVKKIDSIVDNRIDAMDELKFINQKIRNLLEAAEADDDRKTVIRCVSEIRQQLDLQLKIFSQIYDLQFSMEFQETILQTIGECSEDVRKTIIQRLNEKRAVRSILRFD